MMKEMRGISLRAEDVKETLCVERIQPNTGDGA